MRCEQVWLGVCVAHVGMRHWAAAGGRGEDMTFGVGLLLVEGSGVWMLVVVCNMDESGCCGCAQYGWTWLCAIWMDVVVVVVVVVCSGCV